MSIGRLGIDSRLCTLTGSVLFSALDQAAVLVLVGVDGPEAPDDLAVEDLLACGHLVVGYRPVRDSGHVFGRKLAALLAVVDGIADFHAHLELVLESKKKIPLGSQGLRTT